MPITQKKLCLALVAVALMAAAQIGSAEVFHSERHRAEDQSSPLADVVTFVELHGLPTDLGYLCKSLSLTDASRKCRFWQIAIHTKSTKWEDHGFSVPVDEVPPLHIVIYQFTPLAGEFFLLSVDGKLMRAVLRARGTDFIPMSDERARAEASIELAFWQNNLVAIERDVTSAGSRSTPSSGGQQ